MHIQEANTPSLSKTLVGTVLDFLTSENISSICYHFADAWYDADEAEQEIVKNMLMYEIADEITYWLKRRA